ncbi:MAG TPA: STAS domain-containing protein [Pseudonocardiaceae bacterium]|nr:STAS domain-containing protein [Pseudonocardiaceae bacterium]
MDVNGTTDHFRVNATESADAADTGDIAVCAATGELDTCSASALPAQLLDAVGPGTGGVVLDMADVSLVSAAGARALTDLAATLAETGRRLLLARCRPTVRDIIEYAGSPHTVSDHPSVAEAVAAYRAEPASPAPAMPTERLVLLRKQAGNLPDGLRTRPLIAGAIDELRERYRLPDNDSAFALLRHSSQRYNIKLRSLALAFLSAPPAKPERPLWFGGRARPPAPSITFTSHHGQWPGNRGGFLSEVLASALSIMDSEAGYVRLADDFLGGLQLESQRGLPREFGQSLAAGPPATSDLSRELDPRTRSTLHEQGLNYVYNVALRTEEYPEVGVVSTLHAGGPSSATHDQSAALDVVSAQSAAWLHWYQRTVVLDALEHLHHAARKTWLRRDR